MLARFLQAEQMLGRFVRAEEVIGPKRIFSRIVRTTMLVLALAGTTVLAARISLYAFGETGASVLGVLLLLVAAWGAAASNSPEARQVRLALRSEDVRARRSEDRPT